MTNTSDFIPAEFGFLQEMHGFCISDAGDDFAELVGGNLRIIFSRDREPSAPMNIMVASTHDAQKAGNWLIWFGLHQVMWLVLNTSLTYPSDAELAKFLRTNMQIVQLMFSSSNIQATKAARDRLTVQLLKHQAPGTFIDQTAPNSTDLSDA
jgi:hypothetical protein